MSNGREIEPLDVGVFTPWLITARDGLAMGEVGYVATGSQGCAGVPGGGHDHVG